MADSCEKYAASKMFGFAWTQPLRECFSAVSEQDGRVFDVALKSLNFCLFWSCFFFFHFFRCFRYIMAVYVTCEELDKILVLWCTLYAANCVRSRFFFFFWLLCLFFCVFIFPYYSLNIFLCSFMCAFVYLLQLTI